MAWPPVPAMRSRAEHFDALVLDCADRVRPHLGTRYAAPRVRRRGRAAAGPGPWEEQTPPLGRCCGAPRSRPAGRRLPQADQGRAHDDADLAEIVREVVTEQVAALLGVPPHEIDPDRDPDA